MGQDVWGASAEERDRLDAVHRVVVAVRGVHDELAAAPDLRPGARVDRAFARLVRLVVETDPALSAAVLEQPEVRAMAPRLRLLCLRGEYELELAWAGRVVAAPAPHVELEHFPYVENYRRLCEIEAASLGRVAPGRRLDNVAVVGSGPLPLTALLLAQGAPGATVDAIDRDPVATAAARMLAATLGTPGLTFRTAAVGDGGERPVAVAMGRYDLVVLAALVGATPTDKRRVLAGLAATMAPGALLLVRSARGMRTLLYPEVAVEALVGFDILDVVHPTGEVINSVIVARNAPEA
jgi:nicotianamine synthase